MSPKEDHLYRVTWRSLALTSVGNEALEERMVTAAYFQHEDGRTVFKRADGMQVFDVAAGLVETIETIEVLDDGDAKPGAIADQRDARYVFTER